MAKKSISIVLSLIMIISCVFPAIASAAPVAEYDVMFIDNDTQEMLGSARVRKGNTTPDVLIPALPQGNEGYGGYIVDDNGKQHYHYEWDIDPHTTPINANTEFKRLKISEKHNYDFSKPQFKFQENSKSGLMAFYTCPTCGSVGEVGVEIGRVTLAGMPIKIDASAIGGSSAAYEHNMTLSDINTIVELLQKVGAPIPGWVNTVIKAADTISEVADEIIERTSTCSKIGHLYGETPTLKWDDDYSHVTATFTCTREDCHDNYDNHYKSITASTVGPTYTDATCTTDGKQIYTANFRFELGKQDANSDSEWKEYNFVNDSVIWQRKLGHSYQNFSNNDATCYDDGTYYKLCSRCGDRIDGIPDGGSKLEHSPGSITRENVVAPTCTEKGSYDAVRYCIYCGDERSREKVETNAVGHIAKTPVRENIVDATCTNTGGYDLVTYCATCGDVLDTEHVVVPKKAHRRRNIIVGGTESTCTTSGTYTQKDMCIDCNEVFGETEVTLNAEGHKWGQPETVKAATCTESGEVILTCTVCGTSIVDSRPAATNPGGHDIANMEEVTEKYVAPTCANKGIKVYKCTQCDYTVTEEIEKTADHIWDSAEGTVTREPTCKKVGIRTWTCTVCGTQKTTEIPMTEHRYSSEITPPTCTERGYTTHSCPICKDVYIDSYKDAKGHKPGAPKRINEVKATCANAGSYDLVTYCTECGEELTDLRKDNVIVKKKNHNCDMHVSRPTCTDYGYTTLDCKNSECNHYSYVTDIKEKTEHTPKAAVKENVVKANCIRKGSYDNVIYCSKCNTEISRTHVDGAYGDHTAEKIPGYAATCTKDGLTNGSKCSVCKKELTKQQVIKAKGHKWDAGVITKQPTTSETGLKVYTCKECKQTKDEVLPVISVKEATPSDSQAAQATENKTIRKPENIRTFSHFNKKRLLIQFDKVDGAQNYRVMYRKAGTTKWNYAWTDGKTEYYLTNLKKGGLYEFMFAAYKKNAKNEWERGAYSKTSYRYYYKEKIKKVKTKNKSVTVKWVKDKKGNGYELFYATNPEMTDRKKIVINNKKKTSYTIKKLKKGKKYYIRVRSIKKKNGVGYTGEFSSQKKIKVK